MEAIRSSAVKLFVQTLILRSEESHGAGRSCDVRACRGNISIWSAYYRCCLQRTRESNHDVRPGPGDAKSRHIRESIREVPELGNEQAIILRIERRSPHIAISGP